MRIDKFTLKNYKGFQNLQVQFTPGVNLIYGVNGSGKTSLLNAVRIAVSGFFLDTKKEYDYGYSLGFEDSDISIISNANESQDIEKHRAGYVEYSVESDVKNSDFKIVWSRVKPKGRKKNTTKELAFLAKYGKDTFLRIESKNNNIAPAIGYYGTNRIFKNSSVSLKQAIDKYEGRKQGYLGCIFDDSIFKQLLKWWYDEFVNKAISKSNGLVEEYPVLDCVNEALNDVFRRLGEVSETDTINIRPLSQSKNQIFFALNKGKNLVPITDYSDGFRNIIYLFLDIFWRLSTLNPFLKYEELKEKAFGVIMIDEVDLHLHPRWQEQVVPVLRDMLPNIQFFITTHSPIVLGSLSLREGKDQVLTVSDGCVSVSKSLYGLDANTILSERMDAPVMSKEMESKISELITKVEQSENLAEVKAEIEALKSLLGLPTSFTNNLDFAVAVREIELEEKDSE